MHTIVTHEKLLTGCWYFYKVHTLPAHYIFSTRCWHIYKKHTLPSLTKHSWLNIDTSLKCTHHHHSLHFVNYILTHLWNAHTTITQRSFLTIPWHIFEKHTLTSLTKHSDRNVDTTVKCTNHRHSPFTLTRCWHMNAWGMKLQPKELD